MRVLKPVLLGSSDSVEISGQAEHDYVCKCQNALRTLVWHKGSCTSVSKAAPLAYSPLLTARVAQWFENSNKWNPALYPWSTTDFWRRCLFPVWSHWQYSTVQKSPAPSRPGLGGSVEWLAASALLLTMVAGGSLALLYPQEPMGSLADAGRPLATYLQATNSLWKQLVGIQ
jgi:hypothetical protein